MSEQPASFSAGVDRLLWSLHPGNVPDGERTFPGGVDFLKLKMRGDQTLGEVFRECVNDSLQGDVRTCQIEENLAVFAGVRWENHTTISRCHAVAIKIENCDLTEFYGHPERSYDTRYFRLDVDFRIGQMFTHPYPHFHRSPRDATRYSLCGWPSGNVVVDFLEHIYIEHFHDRWLEWTRRLWATHWRSTGSPADENPFETIVRAFHDSQYDVLVEFESRIETLKRLLRNKKDELYPLRVDTERRNLLAYPSE